MARGERTIRRLWRPRLIAQLAIPLLFILVIVQIDRSLAGHFPREWPGRWQDPVHYGLLLVAVLIAVYTVRTFTRALSGVLDDYLGLARGRTASSVIAILLYVVVILIALQSANLDLSGLLVGGALTGVILGIAGQASLSNIVAGIIILFARPYGPGMYLTARAGAFGGVEYSGQVWDISLFYTTLHSAGQEIRIPNSTMVAAVVVVRPQELDVYIPLTLPRTIDLPAGLELLRQAIARCTAARREPQVALESMTDVGYVVGVRVFVAGETERRAVERAIAGAVQQMTEQDGGPAGEAETETTGRPASTGRPVARRG